MAPSDQAGVLRLVDTQCVSCHAGLDAPAGLDMAADFCGDATLLRLVNPGDPEGSVMLLRMRSPSAPMPPEGGISEEELEMVEYWIADGAPCDREAFYDAGELDGAGIYARSCAGCHGAAGEGISGPAMAVAVGSRTPEEIATIAQDGIGGMPGVISDSAEAELVAAYVVETWGSAR
jgi:mono/diheme cytochrome c family protein